MKFLKNIGGRVLAVWGLLMFVLTFLIIFLPSMVAYLIPDPKGTDYFIKLARIWMRTWLFLVACPIKIKGKENFEKGKTYIVTCNHNSLLDPTLSCPFIPGPNKTIAKISFAKVPIFGWYYARGAVLIDRSSEQSRQESFEKMKAVLAKKMHMSIYPEGTRNRTAEPLKSFYNGAFKLAQETHTDIIPAILFNTKKAVPPNKTFYFVPQPLEIHFLKPVAAENKNYHQLKDEVFETMTNYILQHH